MRNLIFISWQGFLVHTQLIFFLKLQNKDMGPVIQRQVNPRFPVEGAVSPSERCDLAFLRK